MKQKKPEKPKIQPRERTPGRWLRLLVLVVACMLLVVAMGLTTSPEQYNLSVGDIAPKTITATKDVIDEAQTEENRERAADAVQPVYQEDEAALDLVMDNLEKVFSEFESIRAFGEGLRSGKTASAAGEDYVYTGTFAREDLDLARDMCETMNLSDWQLTILMKLSESDFSTAYVNTVNAVRKTMEATIREGGVEVAIASIQRQLLQYISSDLCLNIIVPAVRACIMPNMVINQEETELKREEARQAVEPVYYKSGQNIVVAGESVTEAQLRVLDSLGLLEGNQFDVMLLTGVTVLGILSAVALALPLLMFDWMRMTRLRNALILAVLFVLTMGLCVLAAQVNPYLAPTAMVALLATVLLSPSTAFIANTIAVLLVGVLTNTANTTFAQQMLNMMTAGLLSAPVGIFVLSRRRQQRAAVLLAGGAMAVTDLLAMLAIGCLTNNEINSILTNALWSAGGTVLAALLCMAVQPVLEWCFNLVTPYKLLELANPNQPLLRRLLVETPGTYHHSIMVGNLSEAAAEAIGADALLARVGAYYHDIGKIKRPLYFKENQLGDNPHDRTDPRVSAAIITEHVRDGIQMARQARLPERVIDCIAQHHGDTLAAFFFHKMRSMEGGENAQIEDFQYPGPKPQSREAAIIMLADTVEAAIRAGGDQTTEEIERKIRELIRDKIDSGQLNECPLRFVDVSRIVRAFAQVLNGIYHKRIEYPKLDGVTALPGTDAPAPAAPAPASPAKEETHASGTVH